ncbi:MAG TPA: CHASE4 domain-containing protein [Gammaproteobacteria bacterium]|jgi:sensor domain CHASE-containing protein/nitrogen-specific signal transduction histidine kinase|nr:CHASE4 domain-containing protein [Gammaproteobacteria bacterium]
MSLHKKLFVISIVAWALVMGAVLFQSYFFILKDYRDLEDKDIQGLFHRAQEAISRTVESLNTLNVDWAHWNDTYEFLKKKNETYIKENILNKTTYKDIKQNFLLFFDNSSNYFYGSAYDQKTQDFTKVPPSLLNYLEQHKLILKHEDVSDHVGGFISLPEGYALISSYAVSNGEATEKSIGNIVMGYYFNEQRLKKLSETLQIPLSLIPPEKFNNNPEITSSLEQLEKGQEYFSVLYDKSTIHIYTLFKDVENKLIGLLRIDMPRTTYLRGLTTIHNYIITMCIVGILIVALIELLLKYFVLDRITTFKNQLQNITSTKVFSKNITISGHDEISAMVEDSNKMLNVINNTQNQLKESINELTETNVNLNNEISERKKMEIKVAKLNNQLVVAARRAGMADIATSVLHNIGNVLNSTNTSVALMQENIDNSKAQSLEKVADILTKHSEDLSQFLSADPAGKNIPNFIKILSDELKKERSQLSEETVALQKNIQHIKDIITMQHSVSGSIGMMEKVNISDLLENAITINKTDALAHIEIVRDYQPIKKVISDQVKLLQIFVNLIKNAIDSLLESEVKHKKLSIELHEKDDKHFEVKITDNGLGIEKDNILKIFTYGYTTKETGHGFGLHTSAVSAQDMGGLLTAKSPGLGKGATFTIVLPYESRVGEKYEGEKSETHIDY